MVDINSVLDFDILTDVIPSYLDPGNAGRYGYEPMEDDLGVTLYLKVAEFGEDKVRGQIIDFAHDTLTDFLIEGKYIDAAVAVDSYFSFVEALGYADKLITWNNNRMSLEDARNAVLRSSMGDEEKAEALRKLDYASTANNGVVAAMALGIILTAAGIAIPFPCSLILPLLAMQNTAYVNGILGEYGIAGGKESDDILAWLKWRIDPSGYVYDAETNARLEGVTVTAYWIPWDGTDEFWAQTPGEDKYGTVWDAREYDQENPLQTNADGKYAWDVPEGWWRVRYEREDCVTAWSEWMTVPPIRTEVNIGMVRPYAVEYTESSGTSGAVTLTNNTGETAGISLILAAYDGDGRMISVGSKTADLETSDRMSVSVSYQAADGVRELRAFVLDADSDAPLRVPAIRSVG